MADTTTPVTPVTQDDNNQNLDINLEKNTPTAEIQPSTWDLPPSTDIDLNLDLNLPEAEKNKDRLKTEDKKNQQVETPAEEPIVTAEEPISSSPFVPKAEMPEIPSENLFIETPTETPVTKKTKEILTEKIPQIKETPVEETPIQEIEPSSTIEEVATTPNETPQQKIIEPTTLQEDMNIIDNLQSQASTGGLAEEAKIDTTPKTDIETPKTFDLEAMLGWSETPNEPKFEVKIETTPTEIPKETSSEQIPAIEQPINWNLEPEANQMTAPAFTIPTPTTEIPVQTMTQTTIPQTKTKSVKTLLFVVLFAALGFTTYFILQTMYPVELGNIFGKNNEIEQMHASEEVEETTGTIEDITGTIETITGEETSWTIEEINNFGELNDLWIQTEEIISEETDLSKLADYVTQWNELRETGKSMNNNTIIKYGLYIERKATDLLEKIAKGEEINNLEWYFAQFDQYIAQLETLINASETEITNERELVNEAEISVPTDTNAFEETTDEPEAMSDEF